MAGLVIAAALAAAMSSLDSSINAISTVAVTDFYRRHMVKQASERHYLKVAWAVATAAGVMMIGGAVILSIVPTKTLEDTAAILVSLLAAGLFGVYALGFFTTRGDARSVWCGIVLTILFTGWTVVAAKAPHVLPDALNVPFDLYYTGIIGNIVMFFSGYLVGCLLTARTDRSLDQLTVWTLNKPKQTSGQVEVAEV